jgi:hypothetical protein
MDDETHDSVVLTLVKKAEELALAVHGSKEQIVQQRDLRKTDAMKHSAAYHNTVGSLQAGGVCKCCDFLMCTLTVYHKLCAVSNIWISLSCSRRDVSKL